MNPTQISVLLATAGCGIALTACGSTTPDRVTVTAANPVTITKPSSTAAGDLEQAEGVAKSYALAAVGGSTDRKAVEAQLEKRIGLSTGTLRSDAQDELVRIQTAPKSDNPKVATTVAEVDAIAPSTKGPNDATHKTFLVTVSATTSVTIKGQSSEASSPSTSTYELVVGREKNKWLVQSSELLPAQ